MDDPIRVLRRELSFRSIHTIAPLLAALARRSQPGYVTFLFLDADRLLLDFLVVTDGSDNLRELIDLLCEGDHDVAGLVIVTDRTGEVPADRDDDELLWMELVQLASHHRVRLYDWIVLWDAKAFSVAEFAPIPAQW